MLAIGMIPMTKLIDTLRESRDIYSEKLRQLLVNYQKHPNALFCVYEGEDAKYYGVRIDTLAEIEDCRKIPCKGKQDVLKLYDRVKTDPRLSISNTLFFVDHDFDGYCGRAHDKKLYVTPCYSIENMYVQESSVRKILIEEYGVDNFTESNELESLVALYLKLFDEYCTALTTLNAWISLQREKEHQSIRLNLNNQKLNKFISISLDRVEQIYTKEDLSALFPESILISDEELIAKEAEFMARDRMCLFRGKYHVEFLRVFLEKIKSDRQSTNPVHFKTKKGVKLNLSKVNILSELSQYAATPKCLRSFLESAKNAFKEKAINLTITQPLHRILT